MINRRHFLKSLCACGAGALTLSLLPQQAWAAAGNGTKVLFINLNGGLDGLYALQPRSGAVYNTLNAMRPTLAQAPGSLLAVDANFGLHPDLTVLKQLFDQGSALGVLGVGYENMSRSHLDAEVAVARGVPDRLSAASSGFLNRLGSHYGWSNLQAVSVTGTDLAFDGGEYRGTQVSGLEDFYFRNFSDYHSESPHLVNVAYSLAADTIPEAGKSKQQDFVQNLQGAIDSTDIIQEAVSDYNPIQAYPLTQFGKALKDVEILFSTPAVGTQVGYMRSIGFDTHSNQQMVLDGLLQQLNAALAVFVANMKTRGIWDNLIVMVFSEFGRTNQENGSSGTDHGGANPVFLLGGPVNGGGLIGSLSTSDLTNYGWLPMQHNIVEIYRRILMRMDLDPDPIFAVPGGPQLTGLF